MLDGQEVDHTCPDCPHGGSCTWPLTLPCPLSRRWRPGSSRTGWPSVTSPCADRAACAQCCAQGRCAPCVLLPRTGPQHWACGSGASEGEKQPELYSGLSAWAGVRGAGCPPSSGPSVLASPSALCWPPSWPRSGPCPMPSSPSLPPSPRGRTESPRVLGRGWPRGSNWAAHTGLAGERPEEEVPVLELPQGRPGAWASGEVGPVSRGLWLPGSLEDTDKDRSWLCLQLGGWGAAAWDEAMAREGAACRCWEGAGLEQERPQPALLPCQSPAGAGTWLTLLGPQGGAGCSRGPGQILLRP